MQPKKTWADTMPMNDIDARRHPMPHPEFGADTKAFERACDAARLFGASAKGASKALEDAQQSLAQLGRAGLTVDLAAMERSVIASRRRASEHVIHSTFGRTRQVRHAPAPSVKLRIIGATLLLIGSGLAGYAFGLACVALSNVVGGAA